MDSPDKTLTFGNMHDLEYTHVNKNNEEAKYLTK